MMNSQPQSQGFLQAFDKDYVFKEIAANIYKDGSYESHVQYGYMQPTLHIVNVCFLL